MPCSFHRRELPPVARDPLAELVLEITELHAVDPEHQVDLGNRTKPLTRRRARDYKPRQPCALVGVSWLSVPDNRRDATPRARGVCGGSPRPHKGTARPVRGQNQSPARATAGVPWRYLWGAELHEHQGQLHWFHVKPTSSYKVGND